MDTRIEALFGVSGKVVAITGAGGILYSSIGKALAANGARVALLDILGDKVAEVAEEIRGTGGQAVGIACNVLEPDSVEEALAGVIEAFGSCDALINGAGGNRKGACVPTDGNFTNLELGELDKVFQLNYMGTVLPTQVFCRHFAERGRGIVINTSSMSALASAGRKLPFSMPSSRWSASCCSLANAMPTSGWVPIVTLPTNWLVGC